MNARETHNAIQAEAPGVTDGRRCRHHDDDPAHDEKCYEDTIKGHKPRRKQMLDYPLNITARLNGPTFVYIDSEGSLIELCLNDSQAQSIITDWNGQPDDDLAEGEVPQMLNPPLGQPANV